MSEERRTMKYGILGDIPLELSALRAVLDRSRRRVSSAS
jgi:hypothetical protein